MADRVGGGSPHVSREAEIQGDILLAKSECHSIATAGVEDEEIVADFQDMARNAWEALQRVTDSLSAAATARPDPEPLLYAIRAIAHGDPHGWLTVERAQLLALEAIAAYERASGESQ